jgi:hypothetical protein
MGMDEVLNLIILELQEQGWTVHQTPGGVWQFSTPDGLLVVRYGRVWLDSYGMQNTLSLLIRCGLYWRAEVLVFGGPIVL